MGHIMKCVVHVLFAVLVLFSTNVVAQSWPNPPTAQRAEAAPGCYPVQDQLHKPFLVHWVPTLGASHVTYILFVTRNDGSYQQTVDFVNSDYHVVVKNDGRCYELAGTDDYCSIGDVAMANCPSVPLAFCREGNNWVDKTATRLHERLNDRYAELDKLAQSYDTLSDQDQKALIVEGLALREIFLQAGRLPPTTLSLQTLLKGYADKPVQFEVISVTKDRLNQHALPL